MMQSYWTKKQLQFNHNFAILILIFTFIANSINIDG